MRRTRAPNVWPTARKTASASARRTLPTKRISRERALIHRPRLPASCLLPRSKIFLDRFREERQLLRAQVVEDSVILFPKLLERGQREPFRRLHEISVDQGWEIVDRVDHF